jgi:cysteine synthase A
MQQLIGICGNTPLIKVSDQLYAKLETYSPTGSVKDRMITYLVNRGIASGQIGQETVFTEATSGNSGISLAAIAASLKLKCVIFMPSNMSEERKQMMRIYGAEIREAPPSDFTRAISMRDEYLSNTANCWSPMQFSNPCNIECHRAVTAPEIDVDLFLANQQWAAFVHGSGTGGTIEGIRQYLRADRQNDNYVKVCMVVPEEEKHGIQGIGDGKHFLAKPEDMDQELTVSTVDALERAKRFAKETGLLVGISSGANLVASERYLENNRVEGAVVTMLCDRGERYMSLY